MKRKLLFAAILIASALGAGPLFAQFDADKVYTIVNRNDATLYVQDNSTGGVSMGSMNDNSYWKFEATANTNCYYVKNVATGKYMQSCKGSEVEVNMGDNPVEYSIILCAAEGEGMYGMASTDQTTYDFTAGTIGCNWKNNNTVQGFAAVAGTNHRSFWKIVEATLSSPYAGNEIAAGDFFLYNVETGLWLQNNEKNTGDWNTRGATGTYGFEFGVSAIDGGWKLDPKFGHNHSMNSSNFYLDTNDAVTAWTFEPKTVNGVTNTYTIKAGGLVLGLDNNDNLAMGTSQKSTWQLVTRKDRIAYLKTTASETNPIDATFFIMDPSFANENERRSYWQWERDGGNLDDKRWYWNRRSYAVWNSNSFKLSQVITEIPNGTYKLTVKGYYRDGDRDQCVERRAAGTERFIGKYFINSDKAPFMSILDGASDTWVDGLFYYPAADASAPYGHYPDNADAFNRIFQDYPNAYQNTGVVSVVTTKSMTIGIEKMEANSSDWIAFDDFRLTYMGSNVDINALKEGLQNTINDAKAWDASNTTDVLATALSNAIAAGEAAMSSVDEDEISDAGAAIITALAAAQAVNVSLLKATIALAQAEGVDVTAVNAVVAEGTTASQVDQALYDLRAARKIESLRMKDIYIGSAPAAGNVYLFNIGTGLFLGTGSDWNTHAAVDQAGIVIELVADGDNFKMKTNRGGGWLNWGAYVDTGGQDVWHFVPVDGKENVYNISSSGNDGNLLGYDPNGPTDGKKYWSTIAKDRAGFDNPMNQWKVVTPAERDALMETASETNPIDATYLIKNPSLTRQDDYDMWKKEVDGGNGGARVSSQDDNNGDRAADYGWEYYDTNSFKFYQELEGLKPGSYEVSATAFYRDGNGGYQAGVFNDDGGLLQLAYLFANNQTTPLTNIATVRDKVPGIASQGTKDGNFPNWPAEAFEYFETGYYKSTVQVTVGANGKLNLGIAKDSKSNGGDWVVLDNFRLTYLGPVEETITVAVTDAGYATFVAPFEAAVPQGVTATTIDGTETDGLTLRLTQVNPIPANTPVVLAADAGNYDFTGYVVAAKANPTEGWLVGTYEDIEAPDGSYVLQNQTGNVGFFLVEESDKPKVSANRAYLTAPTNNNVKAFILRESDADGIRSLDNEFLGKNNGAIFNLAGQRMTKTQRGVNIVNKKKVVIK